MKEQSQNEHTDFSSEHEIVKSLKGPLEGVWKSLCQLTLAIEKLSRSEVSLPFEVECVASTTKKREKTHRRSGGPKDFYFFNEDYLEIQRVVSAVIQHQPDKNEIYLTPSNLLDMARKVGAFPWKIADAEPTADKDRRAERTSLGRYCEKYKGLTFTIRIDESEQNVRFDAIGQGHTRQYRFTKRSDESV